MTRKGEIAFLSVVKRLQGKGIGSRLLRKCDIFAKRKKLQRFFYMSVKATGKRFLSTKIFGFIKKREYKKIICGKSMKKMRRVKNL